MACTETNVPPNGSAPPASGRQGGGFVRMENCGSPTFWVNDVNANCHGIFNLKTINCLPLSSFLTTPLQVDVDANNHVISNVGKIYVGSPTDDGSGALLQVLGEINAQSYMVNGVEFSTKSITPPGQVNLDNIYAINGKSVASLSPQGVEGSVQFYDEGILTGDSAFIYDEVNQTLRVGLSNPVTPAWRLNVGGDINIVDPTYVPYAYRINGIAFAVANSNGTYLNLVNIATINGNPPGSGSGGTTNPPGGLPGDVQFNAGGNLFGGSSSLFWDSTNNRLGVGTSAPRFSIDSTGQINANGCYLVNAVSFACPSTAAGIDLTNVTSINGAPVGAFSQTPWTSNIDGATFYLYDAGGVGIGAGVVPDAFNFLKMVVSSAQEPISVTNTNSGGHAGAVFTNNLGYQLGIYMSGSGGASPHVNTAAFNAIPPASQPDAPIAFLQDYIPKMILENNRVGINTLFGGAIWGLHVNSPDGIGISTQTATADATLFFDPNGLESGVLTGLAQAGDYDPTGQIGDMVLWTRSATNAFRVAVGPSNAAVFNSTGLGIMKAPAYPLDVLGNVNATGCYYINGLPFACFDGVSGINLTNITSINGGPGGGGGTPAPPDGGVQFNNDGVFGGTFNLIWDDVSNRLGINQISPDYGLHVNGPDGIGITTQSTANATLYLAPNFLEAGVLSGSGQAAYIDPTEQPGDMVLWVRATTNAFRVAVAAGNVAVFNSTGLGIKKSPQYPIDITGDCNISAGSVYRIGGIPLAVGGTPTTPAGTNGQVQFNNAGAFGANANFFWDNTNSRLGIGTAIPQASLDSAGFIRTTGAINAPTTGGGLELFGSGNNGYIQAYNRGTSTVTQLIVVGNPMLLNASNQGNVGIGTANPIAPFHLKSPSGLIGIIESTTDLSAANPTCYIRFQGMNGNSSYIGYGGNTAGQFDIMNYLNAPLMFGTNLTPRMVISGAGGVGIAVANPLAMFDLHASSIPGNPATSGSTDPAMITRLYAANVGTSLDFGVNTNGLCWIQNRTGTNFGAADYPIALNPMGGLVGIGTLNPVRTLDVVGSFADTQNVSGLARIPLVNNNTGAGSRMDILIQSYPGNTAFSMAIGTSNNALGFGEGAYIDTLGAVLAIHCAANLLLNPNGGSVGIGTTTPSGILDVRSGRSLFRASSERYAIYLSYNLATNGFFIGCDTDGSLSFSYADGGEKMRVTPNGLVGIDKVPSYQLDINGDCNVSGTYRINGVPISTGGITNKTFPSRQLGVVYQNNTGKWMFVSATATINATGYVQLGSGPTNPPSNLLCSMTNSSSGVTAVYTVTGWVGPGEFYEAIVGVGATLDGWVECY